VGLLDVLSLDIEQYRYYEQVTNGDMNTLGPFIAFASPVEDAWVAAQKDETIRVQIKTPLPPRNRSTGLGRGLPHAFKCVLQVFKAENVGLVVRLNDEL
jgi:cell division cycle 14